MPSLEAPTLDQLTIAATKLLDAIVEYRRPNDTRISTVPKRESEARKPHFSIKSAADLLATDSSVLKLRDIVADPVGHALKRQLNLVGQAIYDLVGSSDELVKIGERIANTDPSQYSSRMAPLNNAWDGVGKGNDRWYA